MTDKKRLFSAMAKALRVKETEISERTSRTNLPEWDSMNHLVLMTQVEKTFNIKFSADEISKAKSARDIMALLERKR